jgi:hypothetical protein
LFFFVALRISIETLKLKKVNTVEGMMNRALEGEETSTNRPIAGGTETKRTDDDDVLDSDSDDEQEDKLKSIHALRGGGGGVKKSSGDKQDEQPHHNSSKDDDVDDDDDDDEEDDDKVLEKLHLNHPSLRRYDEFSSFLTRSERAHEKPDVPPSKEALARRRVTILVDQQCDGKKSKEAAATATACMPAVGITIHYDVPMTPDEIKAYFMQPADFTRCDDDVDVTTIRWNKAQKGHYKWNDDENTIRGLEEFCITKKDKQKKKGAKNNNSRADYRYQHGQKVLAEVLRQKLTKNDLNAYVYDDEKIRQVSIAITEPEQQRARELAQQDEDDVVKMHNPKWKNNTSANSNNQGSSSRKNTGTRKEKGKGIWSFLQKSMPKKSQYT